MKDLKEFILESIDINNLNFKIKSWYGLDNSNYLAFTGFCNKCKEDHKINDESFNIFYNKFKDSKNFVDFINDNTDPSMVETDYKNSMYNIIRAVSGV